MTRLGPRGLSILFPRSFVFLVTDPNRGSRSKGEVIVANEASWDRIGRVVLGIVLLIVGFGVMDGGAGLIVGLIGLIPLLTGLVGWCPLYSLFGFRTNKASAEA